MYSKKMRFWSCVQFNLRGHLEYDDSSLLNIGFRLWGGCLSVAKMLDNRRNYSATQLDGNTSGLATISETDSNHKNGQEIACLFMVGRRQKSFIDFERFPKNSAPRRYQNLCTLYPIQNKVKRIWKLQWSKRVFRIPIRNILDMSISRDWQNSYL